ncbi:DUF397 domain-containing protein [Streptomyces sp. NPDC051207]|uniref:DUF397 domain-containing protein n=1 Tax=Streptomyces sp. NPDC051207 TaxID=3154641 RepID=UPI0034247CC4
MPRGSLRWTGERRDDAVRLLLAIMVPRGPKHPPITRFLVCAVHLRDSGTPAAPHLVVGHATWAVFLGGVMSVM